jgi:alkylhydroperoxidase/carboxymuconolactone decarboxylase family protein YurZ
MSRPDASGAQHASAHLTLACKPGVTLDEIAEAVAVLARLKAKLERGKGGG